MHALQNVPLDAIADVGDTQVIVYSRWDRNPDAIEAQVTYPIVTAMLGAPLLRAVSGRPRAAWSMTGAVYEPSSGGV